MYLFICFTFFSPLLKKGDSFCNLHRRPSPLTSIDRSDVAPGKPGSPESRPTISRHQIKPSATSNKEGGEKKREGVGEVCGAGGKM